MTDISHGTYSVLHSITLRRDEGRKFKRYQQLSKAFCTDLPHAWGKMGYWKEHC